MVIVEASSFFEVSFVIDLGAGNDQATVEIPPDPLNIPGKVRELRGKILGGAGNDVTHSCIPMSSFDVFLDVDLGTGNDRALLEQQGQFPVEPLAESHSLRANVAAGSDDRRGGDSVRLVAALSQFFRRVLRYRPGAGNDRAMVDIMRDSLEVAGKVRELHLTIDAGAGTDVVQDCEPMTFIHRCIFGRRPGRRE